MKRRGACNTLTPQEADRIFFPGSGGKSSQAKKICDACPVNAMCLVQAIENGLKGFWAGTTDKDRLVMAELYHMQVVPIESLVPEPPKKRRVFKKVTNVTFDTVGYLDTLVSPLD